ncbi:MAG: hypothetical protein Q4A58_00235 [Fusobacterium sp.]|uniref:hypothetical protein n=1 Tax=Fusobacterium sp. TaxID=68766 RepID=UPI0026DB232E|nr:hypothetical protein [Fusobacterium sp.]MDO4689715.1 hypothetical protein [Fusobacterium sp.]
MVVPIYPIFAVVAFLPLIIVIPMFFLVKKTILKNDVATHKPGPTPKRLIALVILLITYIVPVVLLYNFLITKVWW